MSESAYDISYLLEAELAKFSSSAQPTARTEALTSVAAITATAEQDAAATQAATARELLALDGIHEELIRQYMQISRC